MDQLFRTSFSYFYPTKNVRVGTTFYQLLQRASQTMIECGIKEAVLLPPDVPLNHWLAIHAIDIYNFCNKTYGVLHAAFCNDYRCSIMTAGPRFEYSWMDGETIKTPLKCTAPQQIGYMMSWVRKNLDNQLVIPTNGTHEFPQNFREIIKDVTKCLLRTYAHIYYIHYNELVILGEAKLINAGLMHILYFIQEFNLEDPDEMEPFKHYLEYLSSLGTGKDKDIDETDEGKDNKDTVDTDDSNEKVKHIDKITNKMKKIDDCLSD